MKRALLVLALSLTSFSAFSTFNTEVASAQQAADKEFVIFVGQTLTFDARAISRVVSGRDSVATVKNTSDGSQIVITGKSVGITTVMFYTRDEEKRILIRVVDSDPVALAAEARDLLGPRSGVDVRIVKGRVVLEGEVAGDVYQRKIEQLVKLYPDQVLNFTTYREAFVEGARMVALDIYFIQLSESGNDALGIKWGQFLGANYTFGLGDVPLFYSAEDGEGVGNGLMPGEQNPARIPKASLLTGGGNQYWSLIGNVTAAIDFMASYGMIKEIKHATIVTEGGTEANFQSGGTILIPVQGSVSGGELVEKNYGLSMILNPVLDFENRVKVKFDLNISELDYSNSVSNVPALRNSVVKGTVNMQEGQSVLLATHQSILDTQNKQGLAYLSKIPIVGLLFSARNQRSSELNNAVFITPRVYEPGSQYHKTLIEGAFERILDAGADTDELPVISNTQRPRSEFSKPAPKPAEVEQVGADESEDSE